MPKKASKVVPKKKVVKVDKKATKPAKKEVDIKKKGVPTKESRKPKNQPDPRRKTTNGIMKITPTRSNTRKRSFKPTERFIDYIIQKEKQPIKEVLEQKDRSALSNMLDASAIKTIKSRQSEELKALKEETRLQESAQKTLRSQRKAAVKASARSYNPGARGGRSQSTKKKSKSKGKGKTKEVLPVYFESHDIYFEDDDEDTEVKKPKILRYKDIVERSKSKASPPTKSPKSKKK